MFGLLHVGGKAAASDLTDRDREICARIGQELKRRGLVFTGIDVIGDYLTESNVTSPTGIQELRRFSGMSRKCWSTGWERKEAEAILAITKEGVGR